MRDRRTSKIDKTKLNNFANLDTNYLDKPYTTLITTSLFHVVAITSLVLTRTCTIRRFPKLGRFMEAWTWRSANDDGRHTWSVPHRAFAVRIETSVTRPSRQESTKPTLNCVSWCQTFLCLTLAPWCAIHVWWSGSWYAGTTVLLLRRKMRSADWLVFSLKKAASVGLITFAISSGSKRRSGS